MGSNASGQVTPTIDKPTPNRPAVSSGPSGSGPQVPAAGLRQQAAPVRTWSQVQPENPRGGGRVAVAIGGVAVAALAIVGGSFLAAGAFGDEDREADIANAVSPDNGAQKAADSFLTAAREGDCDRAYSFVKRPEQFPGQMEESLFKEQVCAEAPSVAAETSVVRQGAGSAKVRAEANGERYTYAVERVGGQWKIDPLASIGAEQ